MSWQDIRPLAVGVAFRDEREEILLSRLRDEHADETFYRPIGGGIEFGELSEETLAREFREELSVEVVEHELLETLESTFTFHGEEGHEIWFLYEVEFVEDWPYEREEFEIHETEHGHDETFPAEWVPIDELPDVTVYPTNLAEII
jgi:8-oxo-dGTP pyrophosphatase MutT (NUDIX family)